MNRKYKLFRKIAWNLLIFIPNVLSEIIFFSLLPLLIIFCHSRLVIKKYLQKKYNVLFSPISIPMSFLTAKSVKTQGIVADVICYDKEPIFDKLKFGFCLKEYPGLFYLTLLTDYLPTFTWALLKYDIFEFPFSGGLLYASRIRRLEYILLRICAKKIVVYAYGSDSYLPSEIRKLGKYNTLMDAPDEIFERPEKFIRANIRRAQKYAHVLIAGADIIWLGPKAIMLPIAADLSAWTYFPSHQKKNVTLLHSTNHRIYKGTRFIIEVYEELKKEGFPVELMLIEGKTIEECYKLYKKGDIFVPDVITGWYGSTQIEAMSLGKVVVNYQKEIFKPYHNYYVKHCPIVSANPDNLKKVLIKLINNFDLRKELGYQGSEFVGQYHSLEFIGKLRVTIYEELWQNRRIDQKRFEKILKKQKITKM